MCQLKICMAVEKQKNHYNVLNTIKVLCLSHKNNLELGTPGMVWWLPWSKPIFLYVATHHFQHAASWFSYDTSQLLKLQPVCSIFPPSGKRKTEHAMTPILRYLLPIICTLFLHFSSPKTAWRLQGFISPRERCTQIK